MRYSEAVRECSTTGVELLRYSAPKREKHYELERANTRGSNGLRGFPQAYDENDFPFGESGIARSAHRESAERSSGTRESNDSTHTHGAFPGFELRLFSSYG